MKFIIRFFDKLEDTIRGWMSRHPIFYGLVGGIGVVLFWRGVWHMADYVSFHVLLKNDMYSLSTLDAPFFVDGFASFVVGTLLLLPTGLFVSNFIGNEIIISGLRGEKKLAEKTEIEVKTETGAIADIQTELKKISKKLEL